MPVNDNMDKFLNVLLVEDDVEACNEIRKHIETCTDIRLVEITNNSAQAIEILKYTLPDAVILDLELHHGGGNGLLFLTELSKLELTYRPYILVTTNNSSQITHETARRLGADFIMSKHEKNYSAKEVIAFLKMIYPTLLSTRKTATTTSKTELSPSERMRRLVHYISREMDFIGINRKNAGYQYLVDAIIMTYDNPQTNIYNDLSTRYHKTSSGIERSMQYAINRAWKTTPIEDLELHYTAKTHSCRGVPTITEFVYYYTDLLKNNR